MSKLKLKLLSLLTAAAMVFTSVSVFIPIVRAANDTITVDRSTNYQQIIGFGAAGNQSATNFENDTICSSATRDSILSMLYGTGAGQVGLTLFRMGVSPAVVPDQATYNLGESNWNWNASFEPDNLSMINQIKGKYPNLAVFAVPWSPPGWMKDILTNPGFETGDATGWSIGSVGSVTSVNNPYKGTYSFHAYSGSAYTTYVEQTVTCLPNAVVNLSAWLNGTSSKLNSVKLELFYNGHTNPDVQQDITSQLQVSTWMNYTINNITLPDLNSGNSYPVKVRLDIDAQAAGVINLDEFSLNRAVPTVNGSLRSDYYNTFADFMYKWTNYSVNTRGIPIKYLSVQNEPTALENWDTSIYSAAQMNTVAPLVANKIHSSSLNGNVLVTAPECPNNDDEATFLSTMQTGGSLSSLDALAGHNYGAVNGIHPLQDFGSYNKPFIMSEICTGTAAYDGSMTDALTWAGQINYSLTHKQGGFMYWWIADNDNKNKQLAHILTSTTYEVPKRTYMFGQFSRFMRPGDTVVSSSTNGGSSLQVVASKNSAGNVTLVVVNPTASSITADISGIQKPASVTATSATQNLAALTDVTPSAGTFTYTFPAQSVYTFQEYTPLLNDTFETSPDNNWTVASGTWNIVTDGSKVYQQSAAGGGSAYAGNSTWTDYSVSADVKPLSFGSPNPSIGISIRYIDDNDRYFAIYSNGMIYIKKTVTIGGVPTTTTLASTSYPTWNTGTTHNLRVTAKGTSLTFYIDGVQQLTATDSSISSGKIDLKMYNTTGEYDNVFAW